MQSDRISDCLAGRMCADAPIQTFSNPPHSVIRHARNSKQPRRNVAGQIEGGLKFLSVVLVPTIWPALSAPVHWFRLQQATCQGRVIVPDRRTLGYQVLRMHVLFKGYLPAPFDSTCALSLPDAPATSRSWARCSLPCESPMRWLCDESQTGLCGPGFHRWPHPG